jgi:hypothetical protein
MAAPKKKSAAKGKSPVKNGNIKVKKGRVKRKPPASMRGRTQPKRESKTSRLSAARQSMRDTLMLTRVESQGWTIREAAAEAGLTEKAAKNALKKKREAIGDSLLDEDMVSIVESLIRQWQASIGDYEKLAVAAMDNNHPAVAVGAKKGADGAREKLTELLQAVGGLPHDLGTVTHTIEIRAVVMKINTLVEGFVGEIMNLDLAEKDRKPIVLAAGELTQGLDAISSSPQTVQPETNTEEASHG